MHKGIQGKTWMSIGSKLSRHKRLNTQHSYIQHLYDRSGTSASLLHKDKKAIYLCPFAFQQSCNSVTLAWDLIYIISRFSAITNFNLIYELHLTHEHVNVATFQLNYMLHEYSELSYNFIHLIILLMYYTC